VADAGPRTQALHGLTPEEIEESVEAFFLSFPWEGAVDAGDQLAGDFLDAL
jgi:hypothetical protein